MVVVPRLYKATVALVNTNYLRQQLIVRIDALVPRDVTTTVVTLI